MSLLDLFRSRPPSGDVEQAYGEEPRRVKTVDDVRRIRYKNPTKYGNIKYSDAGRHDYEQLRENSRGVTNQSTIARGIVTRLVDNVINSGLTLEASPMWELISRSYSDTQKYDWERNVESLWSIYSDSTEADIKGRMTLPQLQRLIYRLRIVDGEYFLVLRYLNSPSRTNPVAVQVLNTDQVQTPWDGQTREAVENRGGSIEHGIEYDSTGKAIAIHVKQGEGHTRIPFYAPKSGRRFVIHDGNFEDAEQYRGFPELAHMVYELDRLTEYDISELEAVVASALWMGVVEADKDAAPGKNPQIKPAVSNKNASGDDLKNGIERVEIGKRALIMNNLAPGYSFKGFQPSRPNQNYNAFVESFETRIAGALGMPLSVLRQKFQSSYSAARAEILFFWNNIYRRRDDFISGFLNPLYEAWFSEHVKQANISAPGFNMAIQRKAWLRSTWNGISRPVVDPLKEVNAVGKRLELGHTTGEREAKAYNGSDFRQNVNRLNTENELLSDANKALDPQKYAEPQESDDDGDAEGGNG